MLPYVCQMNNIYCDLMWPAAKFINKYKLTYEMCIQTTHILYVSVRLYGNYYCSLNLVFVLCYIVLGSMIIKLFLLSALFDYISFNMTIALSTHRGAVAQDGRIEPGDMILEVNGHSFENMSNDDAVRTLREAVQKPGYDTN